MPPSPFAESHVEEAALAWLESLGYQVLPGPSLAPGEVEAERADLSTVVLEARLRQALWKLNPSLPPEALTDAERKLLHPEGPTLIARNRSLHQMLVNGVTVEYRRSDGTVAGAQAHVLDYDDPENNQFLAVNQYTVHENKRHRRPDIVVFVNGLPLGVIELKNAAAENATYKAAIQQLQTYQQDIPSLFDYNAALVASDGLQARIGALGAGPEWFKPWRTIGGEEVASAGLPELQVLLYGVFAKERLLDLVRYFIVFEDAGGGRLTKKMAGYHQFHAVNYAVRETLRASAEEAAPQAIAEPAAGYFAGRPGGAQGDRRVGVVWHTQGSGKSLTMAFYAGRVILERAMKNPTIVVITDRNDLDDQLFGTFARCRDLLRQDPEQASSRGDLRARLRVDGGHVVFTTIQKFQPEEQGDRDPVLSARRNIVVLADEAHRSQYDFIDGLARHLHEALPNASFIGFTGTPIESTDKNTRAVFGDYISVYDIERAVKDGATVPIFYESRLAKLALDETERPTIDPTFDEATEGEEVERKERLKSKWAQLEVVVGAPKRVALIARDLVTHFERRQDVIEGKAMIVCMSRRICVDLYDEIGKLRPDWVGADDSQGSLKIVMTGSASDPPEWQQHIRNKPGREALAQRFRDPADPFRIVIVRDMWLTGFDAPSLHTMYLDKPMQGHALMQAIARVNRVFRDKPGGLVVDYLGLAKELKEALVTYTEAHGTGNPTLDQAEAVATMQEAYEVCLGLFHGFDWSAWTTGESGAKLTLVKAGSEHILAIRGEEHQPDGRKRLLDAVLNLSRAFALAVPHDAALAIRDDVGFFQAVRAALVKLETGDRKTDEELDHAIRQIVSRAIASEGVIDLFSAAGLSKPDISILSDEFLAEVRGMPQRNLAVELLRKLLAGEIRSKERKNVVQARSFEDLLEQTLRRYQNRAIETAQVIEELIALAKQMREAQRRGEDLGLNEAEVAFYDALEANDSAVKVLGDETLRTIARELVDQVRRNVTIDWTVRENARAKLRVIVRRILRKWGYPPDKQERATELVLEQAAVLSEEWAA